MVESDASRAATADHVCQFDTGVERNGPNRLLKSVQIGVDRCLSGIRGIRHNAFLCRVPGT